MAKKKQNRKQGSLVARLRDIKAETAREPSELAKAAEGTPYGRPRFSYPGWWNIPGLIAYTPQKAGAGEGVCFRKFGDYPNAKWLDSAAPPIGHVTVAGILLAIAFLNYREPTSAAISLTVSLVLPFLLYVAKLYSRLLSRRDEEWQLNRHQRDKAARRTDMDVATSYLVGQVEELRAEAAGPTSNLALCRAKVVMKLDEQRKNLERIRGEKTQADRRQDSVKAAIYADSLPVIERYVTSLEAARDRNEQYAAKINACLDAFASRLAGTYDVVMTLGQLAAQGVDIDDVIARSDEAIEESVRLMEDGIARIQPLLDQVTDDAISQIAETSSANLDQAFEQIELATALLEKSRIDTDASRIRISPLDEDDDAKWRALEEEKARDDKTTT